MFKQVQFLPSFQDFNYHLSKRKENWSDEKKGPLKLNTDSNKTDRYNT